MSVAFRSWAAALAIVVVLPVVGADLMVVLQVIPPLDLIRFSAP